jgi:DNA-binding winged helix-turn-helix (wHTH) protein/tetratricopeptide (TPR) repeat protein
VAAELRSFPPFKLDSKNEQLWRENEEVRLRRKTFAVLRHLAEHPGELVTKAALLDAIWPDVSVSDSMPAHSVRELRKALGDTAHTPRFIETVQGRGYRFIADVKLESVHAPTPSAARQPSFAEQAHQSVFVGREHERSEVRGALAAATSARGHICLISGEAGIGKTRLCAEIAREAEKNGHAVLVGHCSEQEAVPYLPFVEILESWIDRWDSADDLRRAIGEEAPELGRLLPKLRRIIPDLPPPIELPAEQARRQLFNSFTNFIASRSREQPMMLVLEDLHWADDSTLALINYLSKRHSDLPLLMIGTYREGEIDLSPSLSRTLEGLIRGRLATQLRLKGLPSGEVAQMLQGLSGQSAPAAVVSEIHGETDGNPFFVEELFQHLAEENRLFDDTGQFRAELKIGELEVPRNVRLVVGRRFGRLGAATRKILAVAAVIGRSFTFELLEAASGANTDKLKPDTLKTDALLDCLDEARRVGLVRSSAQHPQARFEFSHELIRQAILTELSVARLRRLHLEVAETIERVYSNTLEDHYAELAHHYAQTENIGNAVTYYHLAGQQAAGRSAHTEAVGLFNSCLEILLTLPETAERDNQELATQSALGTVLIGTRGDGAPEVKVSLSRVVDLSRRLGESPQLFAALYGLAIYHSNRGEHRTAQGLAKDLLSVAQRADDPAAVMVGHAVLGQTSYWLGELVFAHANLEQAVALYGPDLHGHLEFVYGLDPALDSLGYDGYTLFQMGYPDQALHKAERGLAIAQKAARPSGLATALNYLAIAHMLRQENEIAIARAEDAVGMANKEGLPFRAAIGFVTIGAAMVQPDQDAKALVQLQRVSKAIESSGSRPSPLHGGALAHAYAKTGQATKAMSLIAKLLEWVRESSSHVDEPWLYYIKGEVLLAQEPPDAEEAERCFRTSIEVAQRIGAKSLELHTTIRLAKLLMKQRHRKEARAMLTGIYNWFTEGLDTPDLRGAKALLEELNK